MNKKGFVSTSLIYTFFIVFLLLMLFLLNSYSRVRFLLEDYKRDIKESFVDLTKGDINLYIMVWNYASEEYELVDEVPTFGYDFDEEFSGCEDGGKISYSGGNISITASKKVDCYAYFVEKDWDIILRVFTKEDANSDRVFVKRIPTALYTLTNKSCSSSTATIDFDEVTRKFKINSSEKTICEAEFTKRDIDVNINIYKEMVGGEHYQYIDGEKVSFTYVKEVPPTGYYYHSFDCKNNNVSITEEDGELIIDAKGEDDCNVYYTGGLDKVDVIIMRENETGVDGYTTGKKYVQVVENPGSGYAYIGHICDDPNATVTYTNGIITAYNKKQTTCRVYFNYYGDSAAINYYLETSDGQYESVVSVPALGYKFNSTKSGCKYGSSYVVNLNHVEVYAFVDNERCDFYFDQATADIEVLVYVLNRETNQYELGSVPVVGYTMLDNSKCTNGGTVAYVNSKLVVNATNIPTVCEVYFG